MPNGHASWGLDDLNAPADGNYFENGGGVENEIVIALITC